MTTTMLMTLPLKMKDGESEWEDDEDDGSAIDNSEDRHEKKKR